MYAMDGAAAKFTFFAKKAAAETCSGHPD